MLTTSATRLTLSARQRPRRAVQHLLLTRAFDARSRRSSAGRSRCPVIDTAARVHATLTAIARMLVSQLKPEAEIDIVVTGRVETFDKAGVLGRLPVRPVRRRSSAAASAAGQARSAVARRGWRRDGAQRVALLHAADGPHPRAAAAHLESKRRRSRRATVTQSQYRPLRVRADARCLAHAFVGAARALDIPARYVTGLSRSTRSARRAFHAWAEAWDQGLGWIGFDPSAQLLPRRSPCPHRFGTRCVEHDAGVRTVPQMTGACRRDAQYRGRVRTPST